MADYPTDSWRAPSSSQTFNTVEFRHSNQGASELTRQPFTRIATDTYYIIYIQTLLH